MKNTTITTASGCLLAIAILFSPVRGNATTYDDLRNETLKQKSAFVDRFAKTKRVDRKEFYSGVEKYLLKRMDKNFDAWMGTKWGLGVPQTHVPQKGKVNCGMFVALCLRHAGFKLPVYKFNRQAAVMAIRSVAPKSKIKYFSNKSMPYFLKKVKEMGPGLFVIGLDFHIGYLRQDDKGLRFVHASYITHTVIDEPAEKAEPIVTSKYRVVGKILQKNMLDAWLKGKKIKVLGER